MNLKVCLCSRYLTMDLLLLDEVYLLEILEIIACWKQVLWPAQNSWKHSFLAHLLFYVVHLFLHFVFSTLSLSLV